jgi:hypothetical protein
MFEPTCIVCHVVWHNLLDQRQQVVHWLLVLMAELHGTAQHSTANDSTAKEYISYMECCSCFSC